MKHSKKLIALIIVFILVLSSSSVAYASSGPYTYHIAHVTYARQSESVSLVDVQHVRGLADNIHYAYSTKAYYFDQSQFVSSHLTGLMQEYRSWNLKERLIVDGVQETLLIPANYDSGLYTVRYTYISGSGPWYVKLNGMTTYSGTFVNAPYNYEVEIVRKL